MSKATFYFAIAVLAIIFIIWDITYGFKYLASRESKIAFICVDIFLFVWSVSSCFEYSMYSLGV